MDTRITGRELDAAQDHMAAADDILDFLDHDRPLGEASREICSALKAHTHATLAVAHALLAAHTPTSQEAPA